MTTPLENTVRPFAQVPIHPQKVSLPAPIAHAAIDCSLGGAGGITASFSLPTTSGVISDKQENYKESSRQSTLVRVENPDDESQYVEFCRADKVTLTKEKKSPAETPRTSSYDTTGAMHGNEQSTTRNYSFQYPKSGDKTCSPRNPPKGGNC